MIGNSGFTINTESVTRAQIFCTSYKKTQFHSLTAVKTIGKVKPGAYSGGICVGAHICFVLNSPHTVTANKIFRIAPF